MSLGVVVVVLLGLSYAFWWEYAEWGRRIIRTNRWTGATQCFPGVVGYTGESVARQINETVIIAQAEEIHELRPARRLTGARELASIDHDVDGAGFASVRSTGHGNLCADICDELCGCVSTLYEVSFWVMRHWGTPRGLCV